MHLCFSFNTSENFCVPVSHTHSAREFVFIVTDMHRHGDILPKIRYNDITAAIGKHGNAALVRYRLDLVYVHPKKYNFENDSLLIW